MTRPLTQPRICPSCHEGRHPHDRFTATGADAGCPNLAVRGDLSSECQCEVVVPPIPPHRCPTCGRAS